MTIFSNQKYIALETFRQNGIAVKTPVWFVEYDGLIWVVTRKFTGKVKRIKNNSKVRIALSNFLGIPKERWITGNAQIIEGNLAPKIISLRNKKYGLLAKLIGVFSAKKGGYIIFSIKLDDC